MITQKPQWRRHLKANFVLILLLLGGGAQLLGWTDILRYDTNKLAEQQYWRLFTAHWVHLSLFHWLLNVIAWLLIKRLFPQPIPLWILLLLCLVVSAGLWVFSPEIHWYVGFSGVIHGLLILQTMRDWHKHPLGNGLLFGLILLKVALELLFPDIFAAPRDWLNGAVIVQAHLYGVLGGILTGYAYYFWPVIKRQFNGAIT